MNFNQSKEIFNQIFRKNDRKSNAFTLAEMMIVLLILSLVMAAFVPVMTSRSKAGAASGSIWRYAANNSDVYFGAGTQGVAIGATGMSVAAGESARLLINTKDATQSAILFQQNDTTTGRLLEDGDNNVGLGSSVLNSSSHGTENVAFGESALKLNTGNCSVAVGASALSSNTSGNHNIALGTSANTGMNGSHYTLAIGDSTKATADGSVAIGGDYTSGSYTGASSTIANVITLGTANNTVYIPGKLVIGNISTGGVNLTYMNYGSPMGKIVSDRRLKNVGSEYSDGLDKIRQLNVYNYTFKKDKTKEPHVGVIAQDLQKVFPNAVTKIDKKYLGIRQEDMFYAMLNSIKQLDTIVQGIVKDVKTLVGKVQQLDDRIIALIKVDQINTKKIHELEKQNKSLELRLKRLEKLSNVK